MKRLMVICAACALLCVSGQAWSVILTPDSFGNLGNLQAVGSPTVDNVSHSSSGTTLSATVTSQAFDDLDSDDYVYLYQVENTGDHDIHRFTIYPFVGANSSTTVGYLTGGEPAGFVAGITAPLGASISTTPPPGATVGFLYLDLSFMSGPNAVLLTGQTSKVMYIISDAPPTIAQGNVINGNVAYGDVVAPIPEPASLVLVSLGAVAVVQRKRGE